MLVSTSSALAQDLKKTEKQKTKTKAFQQTKFGSQTMICFSPDAVMTYNIISVIDCRYKIMQNGSWQTKCPLFSPTIFCGKIQRKHTKRNCSIIRMHHQKNIPCLKDASVALLQVLQVCLN